MEKLAAVLDLREGKDKTFKIVQYSCKLILWSEARQGRKNEAFHKRLNIIASQFSTFRKLIRLGDWLGPYLNLMKVTNKTSAIEAFADIVDLYTTLFDDIYCFGKLGLLSNRRLTYVAERQAIYGWMVSILIGFYQQFHTASVLSTKLEMAHDQKTVSEVQRKRYWANISSIKLLCDFIFNSVDMFELKVNPLVQILSGLISALLGYHKLTGKM